MIYSTKTAGGRAAVMAKPKGEPTPGGDPEITTPTSALSELERAADRPFRPPPPETLEETGLSDTLVESLVFKPLLAIGHQTGRSIATALGMPARPIIDLLAG